MLPVSCMEGSVELYDENSRPRDDLAVKKGSAAIKWISSPPRDAGMTTDWLPDSSVFWSAFEFADLDDSAFPSTSSHQTSSFADSGTTRNTTDTSER